MASSQSGFRRRIHPLDLLEQAAILHNWPYERTGGDEFSLAVQGGWCDYDITLSWRADLELLHMACSFDFKVPEARLNEVFRLAARINEQLLVGHFDIWAENGQFLFRHTLLLTEVEANMALIDAMLQSALSTCERYYQPFQFVVWAGQSASDALGTVLFDTQGQA